MMLFLMMKRDWIFLVLLHYIIVKTNKVNSFILGKCPQKNNRIKVHASISSKSAPKKDDLTIIHHQQQQQHDCKNKNNNDAVEIIPISQANERLQKILTTEISLEEEEEEESPNQRIIAVQGYLTHRRKLGSSLAFIDLIAGKQSENDETDTPPVLLQALLKKQEYQHHRSSSNFKSLLKSLHPGTFLYLEGRASKTNNPGEAVLMIHYLEIRKVSRNPEHVRGILSRITTSASDDDDDDDDEGEGINLKEISKALHIDSDILKEILTTTTTNNLIDDLKIMCEKSNISATEEALKDFFINKKLHSSSSSPLISHAKLARIIVNNLSEDPNYPHEFLQSKGYTTNTNNNNPIAKILNNNDTNNNNNLLLLQQQQYPTLPMASPDILNVPFSTQVNNDREKRELTTTTMQISGTIQNRRRFKSNNSSTIAVLEVLSQDHDNKRIKCVIHPDCLHDNDIMLFSSSTISISDIYSNLLCKGAQAELHGYYFSSSEEKKRPILWVSQRPTLTLCSWRPLSIRYFLDLLSINTTTTTNNNNNSNNLSPLFDSHEISQSLLLNNKSESSTELLEFCQNSDSTQRQWKAAEISQRIQTFRSEQQQQQQRQHLTSRNNGDRNGTNENDIPDKMNMLLEKYEFIRKEYPIEHIDIRSKDNNDMNSSLLGPMPIAKTKSKNVSSTSQHLRKSKEGSRWQRAKKPQLEWMLNQIKQVVQSHPNYYKFDKKLNILDVGGGKGSLANYLASTLGEDIVNVFVIDINSSTIRNGSKAAKRKSLANVNYEAGDASLNSDMLTEKFLGKGKYFDIVVALHACGALSNVALGHACYNRAAFVVTPCCFRSNPTLKVTAPVLPSAQQDINDMKKKKKNHIMKKLSTTDTVSPSIWLQMETKEQQQDYENLKLVAELQGNIKTSSMAIHTLCGLFAKAAKYHYKNACSFVESNTNMNMNVDMDLDTSYGDHHQLSVFVRTMPISFSTRNFCIVGSFESNSI